MSTVESAGSAFTVVSEPVKINSTKTIVVVSYYGPKSPIGTAEEALEGAGWKVIDFPMFRFKNDFYDKVENYMKLFYDCLTTTRPQVILFWYTGICAAEFEQLNQFCENNLQPKPKYVLYTWDDPYNWRTKASFVPEMAIFLDGALTCCPASIVSYQQSNPRCVAQTLYPGFDSFLASNAKKTFAGQNRFVCDVSFLCTNLYLDKREFPDQKIHRAELLDAIEAREDIIFHLYGPESLRVRYPRSYRGFVHYEKQYEIARTSRISLSTHVVSNDEEIDYLNERAIIILGCAGLLLTDNRVNPAIFDGTGSFYFELQTYLRMGDSLSSAIDAIKNALLLPYEEAEIIRNRAGLWAEYYLSWQQWARRVSDFCLNLCENQENTATDCDNQIITQKVQPSCKKMTNLLRFMQQNAKKKTQMHSK